MHADKSQSFLQDDLNTMSIKIFLQSDTVIIGWMNNHSQSTQSNKFAISLQYLKKEIRDGVHFLHSDKHQSFHKLALLLLMGMNRHV